MMASPPPSETTARARQGGRRRLELSRFGRAGKGQGGRVPTDCSRHAVEVPRPHLGLVAGGRVALRFELELPVLEPDVCCHPLLLVAPGQLEHGRGFSAWNPASVTN